MSNFADVVNKFLEIIGLAIPLIFTVTLVVVLWKVTKAWIMGGGDPASIEVGKKTVIAAIIAFVVMAAVWGIVQIVQVSLGLRG